MIFPARLLFACLLFSIFLVGASCATDRHPSRPEAGADAKQRGSDDRIPVDSINAKLAEPQTQEHLALIETLDEKLSFFHSSEEGRQLIRTFNHVDERNITPEIRTQVREHWGDFVLALMQLDVIKRHWTPDGSGDLPGYNAGVAMAYNVAVLQFYHMMTALELFDEDRAKNRLLNDPIIEKNIPGFSYFTIRDRLYDWDTFWTLYGFYLFRLDDVRDGYEKSDCSKDQPTPLCGRAFERMVAHMEERFSFKRNGFRLFGRFFDYWGKAISTAWSGRSYGVLGVIFPIQAVVAEAMGDFRVFKDPHREYLIKHSDIVSMIYRRIFRPADIMLIRRNWFASNAGLPGFWPHGALYVGSPEEVLSEFPMEEGSDLTSYLLDNEPNARDVVDYLMLRFPEATATWLGDGRESEEEPGGPYPARVIEAISEGVVWSSLHHAAHGDYTAAIRPNRCYRFRSSFLGANSGQVEEAVTPLGRLLAIEKAFSYVDRKTPYDFEFDFASDGSVVCTELVVRAWEHCVEFPTVEMMGRQTLPANDIVDYFAEQYHITRENDAGDAVEGFGEYLDFVYFIDGLEREGIAVERPANDFIESRERSRYFGLLSTLYLAGAEE